MGSGITCDQRLDALVHCLCRVERRLAIELLRQHDGPLDVGDLAGRIARRTEASGEDVADARRQLQEALRYRHLPLLSTSGLVAVDDGTVRLLDERAAEALERVREVADALLDDEGDTDAELSVPTVTRLQHDSENGTGLSEAIVEAISRHRDEAVGRADFTLFDDVSSQSVDELFKPEPAPTTRVAFETDAVHVEVWNDGEVEIRVTDAVER